MTRAIAFAVAISLAACSFSMGEPPSPPYRAPPMCEASKGKPVLDAIASGSSLFFALILALVAGIDDDLGGDDSNELGVTAGVFAVGGLVFGVASATGFRKANACREAQAQYSTMYYYQFQQPQPAPYPQPTPYPAPTPQPAPGTPGTQPAPPPIPAGAERGFCRADGTCDAGLTCASNRCVRLSAPAPR